MSEQGPVRQSPRPHVLLPNFEGTSWRGGIGGDQGAWMLSFTLPDLHLSLLHQLVPSKLGSRTWGVGDCRTVAVASLLTIRSCLFGHNYRSMRESHRSVIVSVWARQTKAGGREGGRGSANSRRCRRLLLNHPHADAAAAV